MSEIRNIQHEIEVIENLKAKIQSLKEKQITRDDIICIGKWVYPTLSVGEIKRNLEIKQRYDIANLENILRFAENRLPINLNVESVDKPITIQQLPAPNAPISVNKKKSTKVENPSLF